MGRPAQGNDREGTRWADPLDRRLHEPKHACRRTDRRPARAPTRTAQPRVGEARKRARGRRKLFARVWVRWQLANPSKALPLDDDALAELRSELSSKTNQWLEQMSPDRQHRFLGGLIGAFLFIHNLEELSEYLENGLNPEERARLTSLPPDKMRQELWWRYIRAKFPDMSPRSWEGRPGGPPFRGPHGPSRRGPPGQSPRGAEGGPPRGPQPGLAPPDGIPKEGRPEHFRERPGPRP